MDGERYQACGKVKGVGQPCCGTTTLGSACQETVLEYEIVHVHRDVMANNAFDEGLDLGDRGLIYTCVLLVDQNSNVLIHPKTHKPLTVAELADLCGCSRQALCCALDRLKARNIVATLCTKLTFDGSSDKVVLNPTLAWRGAYKAQAPEVNLFRSMQNRGVAVGPEAK